MRGAANQPEPIHTAAGSPLLGDLGTQYGRKINRSRARCESAGQCLP